MLARRFARASTGISYPFWYLNSAASILAFCTCARASATLPTAVSLQTKRRLGGGGGPSTNHAGCDATDSTVDFVDCCDAVGVEEFVRDLLLTDDDGCRFGFDADYSYSS